MGEDILLRFKFYPATDQSGPKHNDVRTVMAETALYLDSFIPPSREKSLMLTHLEEAMFWGNAAIARNQ